MQIIHRCSRCGTPLKEEVDTTKMLDKRVIVDIVPCGNCIIEGAKAEAVRILRRTSDALEEDDGSDSN